MTGVPKVSIEMSEKDAELFVLFQKHYDTFAILHEAGVFNVRNGKAELNFDSNGRIMEAKCSLTTFKRGAAIIPIIVEVAK